MPAMPSGAEEGILRGLYLYRSAVQQAKHRAQLFGSGPILRHALRAQELLAERWEVAADVWSVTSYGRLRTEALETERWNRLHPGEKPRVPYVARQLESAAGPGVAASDFVKAVPDMIARWVRQPFQPLGTDGFGRSDTREGLRRHFEIDAEHIARVPGPGARPRGAGAAHRVATPAPGCPRPAPASAPRARPSPPATRCRGC